MGDEAKDKKIHCCPIEGCKSAFDRPYRLTQHLLLHKNIRPYICKEEDCTKAYSSKSHLDRHINNVHKKGSQFEVLDARVIYSCPTCMKTYSNRQNLKRHIKTQHIITIHFSCDICKLEFHKKHQLSAHMYVHTGIKAFSCEECALEFISLFEKKRHMRCHKSYECSECFEKFNQWSKYQAHMKTSHIRTEYICDVCGRKFRCRAHIVRHMKIHDSKKVIPCPYENCTRSYSRNSNLRTHILINHEKITHDCSLCNAKLSTKKKLTEHIEKRHNAVPKIWAPKTRATGRKQRKDAGTFRTVTALKLAGLPEANVEVLMGEPEEKIEMLIPNTASEKNSQDEVRNKVNEVIHKIFLSTEHDKILSEASGELNGTPNAVNDNVEPVPGVSEMSKIKENFEILATNKESNSILLQENNMMLTEENNDQLQTENIISLSEKTIIY